MFRAGFEPVGKPVLITSQNPCHIFMKIKQMAVFTIKPFTSTIQGQTDLMCTGWWLREGQQSLVFCKKKALFPQKQRPCVHSECVDSRYTTNSLEPGRRCLQQCSLAPCGQWRAPCKVLLLCVQNQGCGETTCHTTMSTARNTRHLLHVRIQILIFWWLHVQKPFIVAKYLVNPSTATHTCSSWPHIMSQPAV